MHNFFWQFAVRVTEDGKGVEFSPLLVLTFFFLLFNPPYTLYFILFLYGIVTNERVQHNISPVWQTFMTCLYVGVKSIQEGILFMIDNITNVIQDRHSTDKKNDMEEIDEGYMPDEEDESEDDEEEDKESEEEKEETAEEKEHSSSSIHEDDVVDIHEENRKSESEREPEMQHELEKLIHLTDKNNEIEKSDDFTEQGSHDEVKDENDENDENDQHRIDPNLYDRTNRVYQPNLFNYISRNGRPMY